MSKHFGSPLDKAENGKHWKCKGYKDDKENVADVTIGKWHIPKKDKQSKIHIQTNTVNGKYLSAHFVENYLPKLFDEVYKDEENKDLLKDDKVEEKKNVKKSKPISQMSCKVCDFKAVKVTQLNAHMKLKHETSRKTVANVIIHEH